MKIVDKRQAFRDFPGPEILEKILSHLGSEGTKDVNSVTLLDRDESAPWRYGLTARSLPVPGTRLIDIEIYYEGTSQPERLLASPIYNTYVYAKALLTELYRHIAIGNPARSSAESALTVAAVDDWVLADAQSLLAQLYPPSEHKEEYSQLNKIIRKER